MQNCCTRLQMWCYVSTQDLYMKLALCVGGMSGRVLVAAEDPCPSVLPAPFQLGEDLSPNGVVCANFK